MYNKEELINILKDLPFNKTKGFRHKIGLAIAKYLSESDFMQWGNKVELQIEEINKIYTTKDKCDFKKEYLETLLDEINLTN